MQARLAAETQLVADRLDRLTRRPQRVAHLLEPDPPQPVACGEPRRGLDAPAQRADGRPHERQVAAGAGAGEVHRFEDLGHGLQLEAPDVFADRVPALLQK